MVGKRTRREFKVPNTVLISLLKTRLTFFGDEQFGNQVKVKYTRMPKPPGQSYSGSSMANILPAFFLPSLPACHEVRFNQYGQCVNIIFKKRIFSLFGNIIPKGCGDQDSLRRVMTFTPNGVGCHSLSQT